MIGRLLQMKMNSKGEGSSTDQPSSFKIICIREYVAEVRRQDWKKCCPFNLSDGSEESDHLAEMVFASLLQDSNDALDHTPDYAEASEPMNMVIDVDAVNQGPSDPDSGCQNGKSNANKDDDVAAKNNEAYVNVIDNDVTNFQEGPSQPAASIELDAECQNEKSFDDRSRRKLARRKSQKRRLSDIYKELGSCIGGSEGNVDSEFTTDTENYSDDITLDTFIREKKHVPATSKNSGALKNKRKTPQVVEPRLDKRSKPGSDDSLGNDSHLISKYNLRKNRAIKLDLQPTYKRKVETRHRSCLTRKAKGFLKLCYRNDQKHFTEEGNRSRPAHGGAKSAEFVLPTTAISNKNTETASGSVQKKIRESSPLSDNESMAALQLLRLFNAEVNTETSPKTTTEDPALSMTEPKSPCGLEGVVKPTSGSMMCELPVEVNKINGAALPQAERTESGTYICHMSRNPAEFSIPKAKKFMRRGRA